MKPFLTTLVLIATSVPALAHPGAHDDLAGWQSAVAHLLDSPLHIAVILGSASAAVAAGLVLKSARTARSKRLRE